MKRTLIAALAGGVTLFIWGAISHMALPLGETGIDELPNEAAVTESLKQNVTAPGLYFFPGMGDRSEAALKAWEEKIRQGPYGILIYTPHGQNPMEPAQLLIELLTNIAAALLVSYLLAQALPALPVYATRVLFVALLGLLPGLDVDLSYWNWYKFPADYTIAAVFDHFVGWTLAGAVMSKIHK